MTGIISHRFSHWSNEWVGNEPNELKRRVAFRDILRSDAALAMQYGRLKQELAERFRYDRQAYTDGKTAFVEQVLKAY